VNPTNEEEQEVEIVKAISLEEMKDAIKV